MSEKWLRTKETEWLAEGHAAAERAIDVGWGRSRSPWNGEDAPSSEATWDDAESTWGSGGASWPDVGGAQRKES